MFRKSLTKYLTKDLNPIFLISGSLLSLSILFSFGALIKIIFLLFFFYQIIYSLQKLEPINKALIFIGSLSLLSLIPYFAQTFTEIGISILIATITLIGSFLIKRPTFKTPNWPKITHKDLEFLGLVALPALLIVLLALQARTGDPILSIWQMLHPSIFIIYGVMIFNFIYFGKSLKKHSKLLGSILIYLISFTLSAIIFKQGFGFDPFIHRAAVTSLLADGFINPLTPLYSGQYSVNGAFSIITGLSVKVIDIWILPLLASFLIPLSIFSKNPTKTAHYLAPLAIPYMLLTFTVPFSFTFLILLITAYILTNNPSKEDILVLFFINLASIFWHPLIMIGTTSILVLHILEKHYKISISAPIKILSFLSIPTLIALYQLKNQSLIDPLGLLLNIDLFFTLFRNPFAIGDGNILITYRSLYAFRYFFPVTLTILTFILSRKNNNLKPVVHIQAGLLLAIYFISTLFYFDDIIHQEQREFALRLLQAVYSVSFVSLLSLKNNWQYIFVPLLTLSWFFTYPQYNAISPYTSPSVSDQDRDAVTYIHENTKEPYIVLSNQIMAAAALEEYGFHEYVTVDDSESLWYPIPTGAKLYDYYFETYFYETAPILEGLQNKLPEHTIYLAFHNYWPLSLEKEDELRYTLEEFYSNDIITVYKYGQDKN